MAVVYDKATFDQMYASPVEWWGIDGTRPPVMVHYHRAGIFPSLQAINSRMRANVPGFANFKSIAIIGGAFGWTAEILASSGVEAVSVDTSSFVVSAATTTEQTELRACIAAVGLNPDTATMRGPAGPVNMLSYLMGSQGTVGRRTTAKIVPEGMTTANSRRNVQRSLAVTCDCIMTEDALPSFTNTELTAFLNRVEQTRPNTACAVLHTVTVGTSGDPRLNWKTAAGWRTYLDSLGYTHHQLFVINQ